MNGFLGYAALSKLSTPSRQIRALEMDGPAVPAIYDPWPLQDGEGNVVGQISSSTWSPDYDTNVTIAMVDRSHWDAGTVLTAKVPDADRNATVRAGFWG